MSKEIKQSVEQEVLTFAPLERLGKTLPVHGFDPSDKLHLPSSEVLHCVRAIDKYLAESKGYLVHITSSYRKEGADIIALQTAIDYAVYNNQKVLMLHVKDKGEACKYDVNTTLDRYLATMASNPDEGEDLKPMAVFDNTACYFAHLSKDVCNSPQDADLMQEIFNASKAYFDVIIVCSEDIAADQGILELLPVNHGAILVVQAESVRAPVVTKVKDTLEQQGAQVIGSVLNKRRYYIPQWVYSLFFKK